MDHLLEVRTYFDVRTLSHANYIQKWLRKWKVDEIQINWFSLLSPWSARETRKLNFLMPTIFNIRSQHFPSFVVVKVFDSIASSALYDSLPRVEFRVFGRGDAHTRKCIPLVWLLYFDPTHCVETMKHTRVTFVARLWLQFENKWIPAHCARGIWSMENRLVAIVPTARTIDW